MKLLSKHREGETVHRIYDPAKTPLQRVVLSGILPTVVQHHLHEVAQALDPLRLLRHLEDLQQALSRCVIHTFPLLPNLSLAPLLPFSVAQCFPGALVGQEIRAFCHWAVRNGYLDRTPITRGILPRGGKKRIQLIEPDVFDRLLLACRPEGAIGVMADRTAARNRAILWILMDTGVRTSELCRLRLSDVNREQRTLRVEGRSHERQLPLSSNGWYQVLSYLQWHRPKKGDSEGKEASEEPLFLSETYEPLSINALTLTPLRRASKNVSNFLICW